MNALTRYDEACQAIAEARRVDDVKNIRDAAEAMAVYAKRAKNRDLEADAAEIRFRATRRIGELMQQQADTIGMMTGGDAMKARVGEKPEVERPSLQEQGISKNLAHAARSLARLTEEDFERVVGKARDAVKEAPAKIVRSVERRDEIQEGLAAEVREAIRNTPLANDLHMEYLASLEAEEQVRRVGELLYDERPPWEPDEVAAARLANLIAAWNVCEEPERKAFRRNTLGILGEWTTLAEAEVLFDKARRKLGWSMEKLDQEAELTDRHASKIMMHNQKRSKKGLGPQSMLKMSKAMGVTQLFCVSGALEDSASTE